MDIMSLLGGGNIQDILSDSEKVKSFIPILVNLADTFKHENEHSICALASFEDGNPILRVVATKIVSIEIDGKFEEHIVISRNVKNSNDEDLKFNLLNMLIDHNQNGEEKTT